jgi:hypothetical protein
MPRATLEKSSPRRTPGSRRLIKLDSGIRRNDEHLERLHGTTGDDHRNRQFPEGACHDH